MGFLDKEGTLYANFHHPNISTNTLALVNGEIQITCLCSCDQGRMGDHGPKGRPGRSGSKGQKVQSQRVKV